MDDEFDLRDAVENTLHTLVPAATRKGVQLVFDADPTMDTCVAGDANRLRQVLTNLVDNAIKFSPEGSKIDVAVRRIEIDKLANLTVTISDQGDGISKEILPRLFTKFATGDKEARRAKGTGLGLAYVETVAMRHGGSIRAENRKDGGADFVLMLPEAAEETC